MLGVMATIITNDKTTANAILVLLNFSEFLRLSLSIACTPLWKYGQTKHYTGIHGEPSV
jgi:hypothetical protein